MIIRSVALMEKAHGFSACHLCMATRWPQNADEFEEEEHDYRRAPGDSPS
jgi:hypothetical protein